MRTQEQHGIRVVNTGHRVDHPKSNTRKRVPGTNCTASCSSPATTATQSAANSRLVPAYPVSALKSPTDLVLILQIAYEMRTLYSNEKSAGYIRAGHGVSSA
eukprot:3523312-Rhodomonas_salina.2